MQLPLKLFIGLTLYLRVVSTKVRYVTVECVDKCTVTDGKINGGEGDNITLKYIINTINFITFDLHYESTHIVGILSPPHFYLKDGPHFLDFNHTTLINTAHGFSFSFKVINLNRPIHNGKTFRYCLAYGATGEEGSLMINVLYGPRLLGKWESSYGVQENVNIDVNVTLSGNPKPNIIAITEKGNFEVLSVGVASPYRYNVKLKHVQRSQCGRNLTLKAVGYRKVSYTARIIVIFTPSTPIILNTFTLKNCLIVRWRKIESGACSVKYTILYTYSNGTNTTKDTFDHLQYKHCFDNVNTLFRGTVRVQAEVGGRTSAFSQPVKVVLQATRGDGARSQYGPKSFEHWKSNIEVQENKVANTNLSGDKTPGVVPTVENKTGDKSTFKGFYAFIICINVVAVILLIVIIALVLVRARRKNNFNISDEEESKNEPTAEVNGIIEQLHQKQEEQQPQQQQQQKYIRHSAETESTDDYSTHYNTTEPANGQTVQEIDYAELGPGGRIGEKSIARPSLYAEVNVNADAAYYPPLDSSDEHTSEYSASFKTIMPNYAQTAMNQLRSDATEEPIYDLAA